MSLKRSRSGSPSSHRDAETASPATVIRPDDAGEPSGSKVLTIAYPVRESEEPRIGGFLERCHYCRKRIAQNAEVFMYSNLCAFCSAECRDVHIAKEQPPN